MANSVTKGVLLFLVFAVAIHAASATDWYVSTTGDDTNTGGDTGSPFLTIEHAVDSASSGDSVFLADGTYTGTGNNNIIVVEKALTLTSQSGDRSTVIVDCAATLASSTRFLSIHQPPEGETVIKSLTVTGCNHDDGGAMWVSYTSTEDQESTSKVVFSDIHFVNNNATGFGGTLYSTLNTVIDIDDCLMEVSYSGTGAISHAEAQSMTVRRSTFRYLYSTSVGQPAWLRINAARFSMEDSVVQFIFNTAGDLATVTSSDSVIFERSAFSYIYSLFGIRMLTSLGFEMTDCTYSDSLGIVMSGFYFESASEGTFRNNIWSRMTSSLQVATLSGTIHSYNETMVDCDSGFFAVWSGGTAVIDGLTVRDSKKGGEGKYFGPVFCDGINFAIDTTITVTNLYVYNYTNETPLGGGFVTGDFGGANVMIENAYFEQVHTINLDNPGGGAIQVIGTTKSHEVHLKNVTYVDCSSVTDGGCIYSSSKSTLFIEGGEFINCHALGGSGGAVFITDAGSSLAYAGDDQTMYTACEAMAGAGGAVFFDTDSGSAVPEGFEPCGSECSSNLASDYGDNHASSAVGMTFVKDPADKFDNLDQFEVDIEVVDAFATRVLADSGSSVFAQLNKDSLKKGRLLSAKPGQMDEGFTRLRFSLVGQIGEELTIEFVSQGIANVIDFETESQDCKDGEVVIGYPPNTNAFDVCVDGSTVENSTTLDVFMIIFGILAGITGLVAIAAFIVTAIASRKRIGVNNTVNALVLVGILFGVGAVGVMIPDPSDATCPIMPWFWGYCAILIFVPMALRLTLILASGKPAVVDNPIITIVVTGILLVGQTVIVTTWTIHDKLELDYVQDDEDLTKQCASDHSDAYLITLGVYNGLIMLWGLTVALLSSNSTLKTKSYNARDVVGNLSMAVVNAVAVAVLVTIFVAVSYDSLDARFILPAAGFILVAWVTMLLLFFLPVYELHFGNDNTVSDTRSFSTMARPMSSSSMNASSSDSMSTPRGENLSPR